MRKLHNKVALVTGGAKGIGKETVKMLADDGCKVVITDILDNSGASVSNEVEAAGGHAQYRHLDVTNEAEWNSVVEEAVRQYGRIDILVNNAGIVNTAGVLDTSDEIWNTVMNVNAKGTYLGMKYVIPHMLAAGGGSIVNVSSMWGIVGASAALAYQASKGAVRTMTKSVATEFGADNIRANSVHPGVIATDMVVKDTPIEMRNALLPKIPLGREGDPKEVAALILFLASNNSSYLTGSELVIDGGFTAA